MLCCLRLAMDYVEGFMLCYEFIEGVSMKFYVCALVGMLIKWLQNARCVDKETCMCLGTGVSFSVDLTEQRHTSPTC